MTARALRGLDSIHGATLQTTVITYNGIPRTGLSIREVATITGHNLDRIRRAVRNGEIRADRTGQTAVIPVTELDTIAKWATHEGPPA